MKNAVYKFTTAVAVAGILAGCSAGKGGDSFGDAVTLKADSITVNAIVDPRQWASSGDYAAILGNKTDTALFVFSLPDFDLRYSDLTRGEGPDELGMWPDLHSDNADDGGFYVEDFSKKFTRLYMPGRDSLSMKASYKMKNIQAIVNGKKYITSKLNTTDGKKVDYYRLTDWETGDVLDSIATLGVWFTDKIGDYTVHYQRNSPMCTSYGDKLAIAYAHTGRVDFYDLKDDKFALYKSQGDLRTIEQLQDDMPKLKDNAEGSVEEVASDKNYVYVLERTKIKEDANGLPTYKCIVKVYGWDGSCMEMYELDKQVTSMILHHGSGKLFCYDNALDFEQVYVYTPKGL